MRVVFPSLPATCVILLLDYDHLLPPLLTVRSADLLRRHRRRCRGPRKPINRRKACDTCVQAKSKCDYTQPACTRCAKRGTQCVYAVSSAFSTPVQSQQQKEVADTAHSGLQSSSSRMGTVTSIEPFELDLPTWDFSTSPFSLGTFDMHPSDIENSAVTLSEFTVTQPAMAQESPGFTPFSQALSLLPASRGFSAPTAPSSNNANTTVAHPPSPTSIALLRTVSQYPSLLMKGSFFSPFLHFSMYSLYSNVVPDMTFLPQTSMAICCASGINIPDSNRFFRRAMDAARQRLIGSFVSTAEAQLMLIPTADLTNVALLRVYAAMGCTACHADL